ncbi:MAG: hypothetical protein U9Q79_06005, partial [Candidatus Hydrogenedentes bacterium]|nr:hypothetical protein [Candidatus Hydrogenedentota bacterium]
MAEKRQQPDRNEFTERADPSPIYELIIQTRGILRRSWIVTGLALTSALLVGTSVAVSLLDIAYPLNQTLRTVAFGFVLILTLYALIIGVLRPALRRLTHVQIARRIERTLPNIHNRLVS